MVGKRKKALALKAQATIAKKNALRKTPKISKARKEKGDKDAARRAHKLDTRKKNNFTAEMWAEPAPSHLVAKLEIPKVNSKYKSYFEFADNTEKKDKKLEFQVTNDPKPPPGFAFVPIGDPAVTNACKELSRERDAMIFIVSGHKEENSKISEHIYRTGYHFRETIVEEAREVIGEAVISIPKTAPGFIEPIPESQEEINKQADGAIRDLFPRIPNTDRQMIIEHAFKKGALFHGEPTVGLQAEIALSRRVQLAVLAHIRHTHTRYDKLLRETTWMNARKVVEPVCLDVLVKWRGDEETGRDQMDEILREVVIITDSEGEDDSSDGQSSDDEGEVTSISSRESSLVPPSRIQQRQSQLPNNSMRPASGPNIGNRKTVESTPTIPYRIRPKPMVRPQGEKKAQRGFKRYQAAWDEAKTRQQEPSSRPHVGTPFEGAIAMNPHSSVPSPLSDIRRQSIHESSKPRPPYSDNRTKSAVQHPGHPPDSTRPGPYYIEHRPAPSTIMQRDEVIVRPLPHRPSFYQDNQPRLGAPFSPTTDQRPPQVVRASPTRYGLQDMPLPSIETLSSGVPSLRVNERHDAYSSWESPHPQRVNEHRRQSLAPRQVIVIDDDSPPVKRRRFVHEDDSGRFRSIPSRDIHIKPQYSDSPLMSTSLDPPRDPVVRHSRVQSHSTQGLFQDINHTLTGLAPVERLPVYDAPESGFFTTHPSQLGRSDVGYGGLDDRGIVREKSSFNMPREIAHDGPHRRRPINNIVDEHLKVAEPDRGFRPPSPDYIKREGFQRHMSPKFPVASNISRSYNSGPGTVDADQDFIHNFSQSRLDGPLSRTRDGFPVIPERSYLSRVAQGNYPQGYQDHSARSFATIPSVQERSPVKYVESQLQHRGEMRQPLYYEPTPLERYPLTNGVATSLRDRQMPSSEGEVPTYIRTLGPRRQVIVLD